MQRLLSPNLPALCLSLWIAACEGTAPSPDADLSTPPADAGQNGDAEPDGSVTDDGADSAASAPSESGVPRSRPFGELTDAEAQRLCVWNGEVERAAAPTAEELCRLMVVPSATDSVQCRAQVGLCELTIGLGTAMPDDCSQIRADGLPGSCGPITVHEYERCVRASYARRREAAQGLSCDTLGDVTPPDQRVVPECERVAALCSVVLP